MTNHWKELQSRLWAERRHNTSSYSDLFGAKQNCSVLEALVRELSGYLFEKPFIFYPHDDLTDVLGIDQDEIMDVVSEVIVALGHPLPKSPVTLPNIRTVGDLYQTLIQLHEAYR